MSARLVWAVLSSLLEQAVVVAIVLWGLPQLGIKIPVAGLAGLMAALAAYSVIAYRMGSRALRTKPVAGLTAMVGTRGKVVSPLAPEGLVRIEGELWEATSSGEDMDIGEEVIVTAQDRLRLVVRRSDGKE